MARPHRRRLVGAAEGVERVGGHAGGGFSSAAAPAATLCRGQTRVARDDGAGAERLAGGAVTGGRRSREAPTTLTASRPRPRAHCPAPCRTPSRTLWRDSCLRPIMANQTRIVGVDFVRGIVLVAIMIDHVPGNALEGLTPRNFALSDSAEAFVFLSGLSVGLAYYGKTLATGLAPVTRSCLARAGHIYGLHVGLTIGAVAIFGLWYWFSGFAELIEAHGRAVVFHEPVRGAIGVALLSHQLGYFNILPLYVALMMFSPLILAMARINLLLALFASSGAYLAVRMLNFHLPNWPEPGGWFFNPFAWQLIFTLGVLAAIRWRETPLRRSPAIRAACLVLAVAGAIVVTDGLGLLPGLHDGIFAQLDVGKQNLGAARLVNFLALAYVIATAPFLTTLAQTPVGQELRRLGRHSLEVFAAGSLLSALGQAAVTTLGGIAPEGLEKSLESGYILACIGGLVALARYLECRTSPHRGGRGALARFGSEWRRLFARSPRSAPAE
jgi:hypothetical protein